MSIRANIASWALIVAVLLSCLAWLPFTNVSIVPLSLIGPVAAGVACALLAGYYRAFRAETKLADALDCMGQVMAFMITGVLLSYLAATMSFPEQDALFYALDRSLGLDWLAYLKAIDARPWLGTMFGLAYASILPQIVVLVIALAFSGRGDAARIMVFAMMLSALVSIAISGLMPAVAMFVHLGLTPADYPNLNPGAAFVHVADIKALRSGASFLVDLSRAEGIITFPSYHAALALLMLLAGWTHPLLRWPFVIINLLMIAATPIDGGHYFIDVFAGLGLALLCHAAARRCLFPSRVAPVPEPAQGAAVPVRP
ncbi:phosphatase PAP2 family protein [Bosea sp. WAO]|uniref:phosphatase PAP2 family protein n=1 Tax=Bosea sp. WAO TaxID=406341 RepID=UPI00082E47E2|nr:phosphatase PAP2 family protein [Bosea sp. WAO]